MLAPGYAFRLPAQDGIGDCLNFILLPGDWWSRAERTYGVERVAEFFVKYGSPVGAEPAAAATTTAATTAAATATVAAEAIYLPRAPQAVMPAPRLRPNPWGVVLAVGLLAMVLMRCYHHYEGIQQERAMQTACATGGPMFEAATKKLSSDEKASYLVTFRKQMGC
ncbi:hypothetical protein RAS12_09875 [Achromobacter seleniivolatilans]|uniref:Uncharacterized protein n=1 Tax=Achromobacter seleniivolatilans TaxID=3047478 RepID=A0ABY9M6P7_9BURK|nr:hypothetical protein [Achromobacter sp. R39]WMD22661.1 hypothetical protein RAS12_09875 [Achromobacter sp. R39]